MQDSFQDRLSAGIHNLLINCAECQKGDKLLIVFETETDGYYDVDLGAEIAKAAAKFGLSTQMHGVPLLRDVRDPEAELATKMMAVDCTVFVARLGDQIRFRPQHSSMSLIVNYALDMEMMASSFGRIDYRAFERLKVLVNTAVAEARDVHINCPAGTDFRGSSEAFKAAGGDTTIKRFPLSVFAPVPVEGFRGRVAQNGFLTGTGSHYYSPWSCELKETLFVNIENSRITGFDGSQRDIKAAKDHYEFVGDKYGIDTYFVHSWHAGIHPGCEFKATAGSHFERWSGSAFGNPRLLHFHTCGGYPPGEISLNVLDPTVRLDGVAVWENGRLYPERLSGGAALLDTYPDLRAAFDSPATEVGQSARGGLEFA